MKELKMENVFLDNLIEIDLKDLIDIDPDITMKFVGRQEKFNPIIDNIIETEYAVEFLTDDPRYYLSGNLTVVVELNENTINVKATKLNFHDLILTNNNINGKIRITMDRYKNICNIVHGY